MILQLGIQPSLEELDVHQLPDQGRADTVPSPADEVGFHFAGDLPGEAGLDARLPDQGIPDSGRVPGLGFLVGQGVHHQGEISGLPAGSEHDHLTSRHLLFTALGYAPTSPEKSHLFVSVLRHFWKPPFHR